MAVRLSDRVDQAVAIYKRVTPVTETFRDRVELGFLLMGMTVREREMYYVAVMDYRNALAKAETEVEWPVIG